MELDIAGSKSNPKIHFSKDENRVVIHGRSVLKNMDDAIYLGKIIQGDVEMDNFYTYFEGKYSNNFDPNKDLKKLSLIEKEELYKNLKTLFGESLEESHIRLKKASPYGDLESFTLAT